MGAVGTTSTFNSLCAPGNNIPPAWAAQGANPDVPSGGGWMPWGSLCPDATKGPARQPAPSLSATLSSAIAGGQNGTLPVVGGLYATESSPWDLETDHPIVGSPPVAESQEPHHFSQTSPTTVQTVA